MDDSKIFGKKKMKYFERDIFSDKNKNLPQEYSFETTKSSQKEVDLETNLLFATSTYSDDRSSFEYEELDQSTYNTHLKVNQQKEKDQFYNYFGHTTGPGRGFGNLTISNDIRQGSSTRLDNNQIKLLREQEINSRYDFLDKNFQNPGNLIMPFARGGEVTRKSSKNISENDNDINEITMTPGISEQDNQYFSNQSGLDTLNRIKVDSFEPFESNTYQEIESNNLNTVIEEKTEENFFETDIVFPNNNLDKTNSIDPPINNLPSKKKSYEFNY